MRYAILTDIHANHLALQAVMQDVEPFLTRGEPLAMWFLGDLLGYGPHPIECLQWLRKRPPDLPMRWTPGNHDEWFRLRLSDDLSNDARVSLSRHAEQLARPEHEALGKWFSDELAQTLDDKAGGLLREAFGDDRMALGVHAALSPSTRRTLYLKPWMPDLLRPEFLLLRQEVGQRAAVMFCGHNHFPMWVEENGTDDVRLRSVRYFTPLPLRRDGLSIVNPGSVGQPRDGDPRAAYALFDTEAWTIEFRRLQYDWNRVASHLWRDSYPKSLAERLVDAKSDDTPFYLRVYQRPQWDLRAANDAWTEEG